MPKIYRIIGGTVAILLAIIGQNRLEKDLIFDAILFYDAGIILLLASFFWTRLPELSLDLADAEEERWLGLPEWSQSWWWQLALVLVNMVGIGAGIWALYEFNQDFYRPASHAWPLYVLGLFILLLSAALLDGAPYALWWLTNAYLGRRGIYEPGNLPLSPVRLLARFLRFIRALMASTGYLLGFWRIAFEPPDSKRITNPSRLLPEPQTDLEIRKVDQPRPAHNLPWSSRHTLIFLGAFAIALFMRLFRFDVWPLGTWYDESAAGLMGLRMVEDPAWRPVFPGSINITAHYTYLIAKAIEWLGPTTQAVRSVSVLMGLLTVPAAYMAGRELFGRSVGLIFMFFMATSRWHVNFSRIGMYNIATPLFELLALAYLLMALRRNRFLDFALAGLFFGLGLSFYPAFQLFVAATGVYLLYKILFVRGFLVRYWYGLVVMTVLGVMVLSPLALFAYKESDIYFARTRETSLLTTKAANEQIPAIIENTRKHLLMFNYRGDPNGRHNLPGEPMMDPYTGALMVLGLVITLRWFWRPRTFFLLVWLAMGLLGGILSLDFEAPQSLRSIATQPVVYLLATLPVYLLWREWNQAVDPYFPGRFSWLAVLLLVPVAFSNGITYFVDQRTDFAVWNAYSTPETLTAQTLNELDDNTEAYVISYFHGHPSINLLARDVKPFRRLETTDHLPLDWPPNKDIMLIMNSDSRSIYNEARRFYPDAVFEEVQPPFGGPPVLYKALLRQSDLNSIQGLMGYYYDNGERTGSFVFNEQNQQLSFDWTVDPPVEGPFSAEWFGVLKVDHYGPHQFFLQAPAEANLYIGEKLIISVGGSDASATEDGGDSIVSIDNDASGENSGGVQQISMSVQSENGPEGETQGASITLAQGNHAIRLEAVGAPGTFNLAWRPPDRSYELVPPQALYVPPVSSNGLLGNYYENGDWQGPPTLARIDANFNLYFHVTPLNRPYTVEWSGKIAIPVSGEYVFGLESIDESILTIGGQEVVSSLERNQYMQGGITLDSGLHDIVLRFADRTDHTHVNLYWIPPGGVRQIVPAEVLFPPQASYERVTLPTASALQFDFSQPGSLAVVAPTLLGEPTLVVEGIEEPIGVAVTPSGTIFVSDVRNRRVLGYSAGGELVAQIMGTGPADNVEPFGEPFDLAVNSQGQLLVLDAERNQISVFDGGENASSADTLDDESQTRGESQAGDDSQNSDGNQADDGGRAGENLIGEYVTTLPIEPALLMRVRGLHVDPQDHIWVPLTPRGRVVAFDPYGDVVADFAVWPGENSQPVDIAVDTDGDIWVTDSGLHKLIRFDANGQRELAWDIPHANTLHGPHLDLAADGTIYLTEPEAKRIAKLDPDGERLGQWMLAPNIEDVAKPVGIDVDAEGRIWYVDHVNRFVGFLEDAE